MKPKPPEFDNSQAVEEGWSIFTCHNTDNGPYQLQCCDNDDVFLDDNQAWEHVTHQAKLGSDYHQKALDYLRDHNPLEIKAIERLYGATK